MTALTAVRLGDGLLSRTNNRQGMSDANWKVLNAPAEPALRAVADDLRRVIPDLSISSDPAWIADSHGWPENPILLLVQRDSRGALGAATFTISKSTLVHRGISLRRPPVRQYTLSGGIVSGRTVDAEAVAGCFEALALAIPSDGVVRLSAIPVGSPLHEQLRDPQSDLQRRFYVLPWGEETLHCRILWDGSFEKYLSSLGKVSRKDLRRNWRALLEDPTIRCEVRAFRAVDDVDQFLRDSLAISEKTYQSRKLGIGLAASPASERAVRGAASLGRFLGYVMYIDGTPVAFEYSVASGDTCLMKEGGYDPAWADRHVASVLFLEALRDFERIGLPVKRLDLMPTVNLFKLRTANDLLRVRHFYLFPRNRRGAGRFLTLGAVQGLSQTVRKFIGSRDRELDRYRARALAKARERHTAAVE